MTTIESVLAAYGGGISADEFAEQLAADLADQAGTAGGDRAFTAAERAVLIEGAIPAADLDDPIAQSALQSAGAQTLQSLTTTYSTAEAAELLGRSESRIRNMISEHSLFSVKIGHRQRLPRWQFADRRLLPHLRSVIAAVPDRTPAAALDQLMTLPSDELHRGDTALSPRDWLLSGAPLDPVLAMVGGLFHW